MLTPFRLAKASIKKDKKNYLMIFIIMVISMASVLTMANSIENYKIIDDEMKNISYGNYGGCFLNLNEESQNNIKKELKNHDVARVYIIENDQYEVATYDEIFFKNSYIKLLEGALPEKDNDIVVVENLGKHVGEELSINDHNYVVSGIINNYHLNYSLPYFEAFTSFQKTDKSYSYITGDVSSSLYKDRIDFIYNSGKTGYSSRRYYTGYNLTGVGASVNLDVNSNKIGSFDASMNTVIVFVCLALLFAGFDEKRTERVYFYKSLGMEKGQTYSYVFYESIMLACLAFIIAYPLSLLLSYIIYIYTDYIYQLSLPFHIHFYQQFISTALCFVMVGLSSFIGVFVINIRSFDSLIYRKNRTKLKKYNKAKRMNSWNIWNRLKSVSSFAMSIILVLFLLQAVKIYNYISSPELISEYTGNETYYSYRVESHKPVDLTHKDALVTYQSREKRVKTEEIYNEEYDYSAQCSFILGSVDTYDYSNIEGRLPENKNECMLIVGEGEEFINKEYYETFYNQPLDIGETITVNEDSDNGSKYQMTIVGIGFVTNVDLYENTNIATIVDDSFHYVYRIESKSSLIFDLLDEERSIEEDVHVYSRDVSVDFMYAFITMLIAVVFLIIGLLKSTENFKKEMTLFRCLGMDKNQIFQIAHLNYGSIVVIVCLYAKFFFIINRAIWFVVGITLLIVYVIYMSLILHKFKDEIYFTPADVKRFY